MEANQVLNQSTNNYYEVNQIIGTLIKKNRGIQNLTIYDRAMAKLPLLESILGKSLKELLNIEFAIYQGGIITIIHYTGIIQYVSDKVYEIFQYSREELIGKTYSILKCEYHPQEFFRNRTYARISNHAQSVGMFHVRNIPQENTPTRDGSSG